MATQTAVSTHVYRVNGMTCDHCRRAVTSELMALDGVHEVEVDLPTGRVAVTAAAQPDREQVAAAVFEAGYDLVAE